MQRLVVTMLSVGILLFTAPPTVAADQLPPEVTEKRVSMTPERAAWSPCGREWEGLPPGCEYTVLRGDLTQPGAAVFFRVPASARFPRFWHPTSESGLVIQGQLIRQTEDGKEVVMTPGTYWFIPAGMIHGGSRCWDDGPCLIWESYDKPFDVIVVKEPF